MAYIKLSISFSLSFVIISYLGINIAGFPLPETAAKTVESVLDNSTFTTILEVSVAVAIFVCIFLFAMQINSSVCSLSCKGSCCACFKEQDPNVSEQQDDKTSSGDNNTSTVGELDEGSGEQREKYSPQPRGRLVAKAAHQTTSRSTINPGLEKLRLEDAEKLLATLEFIKYMKRENKKRYHDSISLNSSSSLSIDDIDIIPTKTSVKVKTKGSPRQISVPIDQFSKRVLYT